MKVASAQLIAHLAASKQFMMADCFTFTMPDGVTSYRYTSFDSTLTHNGYTYVAGGPVIDREAVRTVIGLEVDSMTLRIAPKDSDLIGAKSWFGAACAGDLDGVTVKLIRAFIDDAGLPLVSVIGSVNMFIGSVAQLTIDRNVIEMIVNSQVELLNTPMPRNLYQAGCQHTLFDGRCALSAAAFVRTGTVTAYATRTSFVASISGAPATGYCDGGVLQFTSGALLGLKRTVKRQTGTVSLLNPTAVAPTPGDTFNIWPGCDKGRATCESKFANLVNFKGFPYVPVPETAY